MSASAAGPQVRRRDIVFASVGAIMEWYDFMIFAYLAPVLSRVFFPDSSPSTALLSTLAIYAVGFLMGPIGSLFFGSMGDRLGRKWILTVTVGLMIIPMAITSVLPSYAAVGLIAPLLLVGCRLIQGFAVGGQYGGTMVVMIESAPTGQRGRVGSYATMTSGLGVLLAALVATVLTFSTTDQQMESWGWRCAYIFGTVMAIAVYIMRRQMKETESFDAMKESGEISEKPLRGLFRFERRALVVSIVLASYANIVYYMTASYIPTQLTEDDGQTATAALLATTMSAIVFAVTAPFWGRLSDKIGRVKPVVASCIVLIVLAIPAFLLLGAGSTVLVYVAILLLLLPQMAVWGSYGAMAPELFTAKYRNSGTSISYNVGNSIFGGSIPFISTAMIALTGWAWSPALILVISSLIMLPIALRCQETAQASMTDLDHEEARLANLPTQRTSPAVPLERTSPKVDI